MILSSHFSYVRQAASYAHVMRLLWGQLENVHQVGILTAWNPIGQPADPKENKRANQELMDRLRGLGLGPIPVKGKFGGLPEDSFLVPGLSRRHLIQLGQEFEQAAVIWGRRSGEIGFKFEYIDFSENPDGKITDIQYLALGNPDEVQDRKDFYSLLDSERDRPKKYPGETLPGKKKFLIPFFDEMLGGVPADPRKAG